MEFKCYLAGPITGKSYEESESWRNEIKALLADNIAAYSPLRCKEYLKPMGPLKAVFDSKQWPLSTSKGILVCDHNDVLTSDLVIVNFLGCNRVSIGTVMEVAWAYAYDIPTVVIMEPGNVHEHAMIEASTSYVVNSVADAADIANAILNP